MDFVIRQGPTLAHLAKLQLLMGGLNPKEFKSTLISPKNDKFSNRIYKSQL